MASLIDRFRNLSSARKAAVGGGAAAVAAAIVGIAVFAVSGGADTPPTTTSAPTSSTTTTTLPPAPLTGVTVADRDVLDRPAISVKLGNNPEARPQQGIAAADVMFEEEVEGRVTRFLAVFHSTPPERFGPIRSVRLMDGPIARQAGGIFVYSGGANVPERITRLEDAGLRHLNETQLAAIDGARILDPDHGNGLRPNILFSSPAALWDEVVDADTPRPLFPYLREGLQFAGQQVDEVRIPVGGSSFNPTWRWNEREGVWERFYGDEPVRSKSGEHVAYENLVVQFVEVRGEESIVVGEGDAVVLADGKMVQGRWVRQTLDDVTTYLDESGREIELTPGRTWVHLPRTGGSVTVLGPDETSE